MVRRAAGALAVLVAVALSGCAGDETTPDPGDDIDRSSEAPQPDTPDY